MLAGPPRAAEPLNVVIAGGTGALGRRVAADLVRRGHDVTILTRSIRRDLPFAQVAWDGRTVGAWEALLDAPNTAVINLAGKLVDCRPTAANIAALTASRVDATRALVAAARGKGVRRWVQASTTAIWSDAGERWCTEDTPVPEPGLPQMTGVARPWEEAAADAETEHMTVLRTSIVLDTDSPAMAKMVGVTRAFLGVGGSVVTVPLMRRNGHRMAVATALANPLTLAVALPATAVFLLLSGGRPVGAGAGFVGAVDVLAAAALLAGSLPVIVFLRRRGPRLSDRAHARWYVGLLVMVAVAMTAALFR
ncbi:TSUP family transporter [Tsukamurella tyrosinosolvens]|uniref:TSUP family transporter n=1 Tax=Tsukamurella tyrosinosolvens TaxID=57704 RepID=UPI002161CA29|nr:TSUP family transporter [Tsukamurella tyrosinosolvens]